METPNTPAAAGRPKSVTYAVVLIFVALVLGLVRAFLEFSNVARAVEAAGGATLVAGAQVVVFGLFTLLAVGLARRHGWVRYIYALLFLFGLGTAIYTLPSAFAGMPVSASIGLAQLVIQVVVLVLLFKRESGDWYAHRQ